MITLRVADDLPDRKMRLRSPASVQRPYPPRVGSEIWVGAVTTLTGAVAGGTISYALSRQQLNAARVQRNEEERKELQRRSEERRFQAYSNYLTCAQSYRNIAQAYYLHPDNRPTLSEIDTSLHAATDASALVFLVTESEGTHKGSIAILGAIWRAQKAIHHITQITSDDPWTELNNTLGSAIRQFQNAARIELSVNGPAEPWIMTNERSHPDILAEELKPRGGHAKEPLANTQAKD